MNAVFDGSIGNGGVTVLVVGPLALVGVPEVGLVGGVLVLGQIPGNERRKEREREKERKREREKERK
jgi:hypothetical protein